MACNVAYSPSYLKLKISFSLASYGIGCRHLPPYWPNLDVCIFKEGGNHRTALMLHFKVF